MYPELLSNPVRASNVCFHLLSSDCLTFRQPALQAAGTVEMQTTIPRLNRARAGLLVVDVQERLLPAIFDQERVVQNVVRLIKASTLFGLPILVTEQYRKGLGPTVPEIASAVPAFAPLEKLTFSACGGSGIEALLRAKNIEQPILCGIEAHVCVLQTALDLLRARFNPFVVADATSSRTAENHRLALERMRYAGAVIVSTEMALFELLGQAGTQEFKEILTLVR